MGAKRRKRERTPFINRGITFSLDIRICRQRLHGRLCLKFDFPSELHKHEDFEYNKVN